MISVILPAYNEEKNIGFVIDDISNFFKKIILPYEIIVVNDGSKDKTLEVLNKYKKRENIIVVSHIRNLGYGSALRSGFSAAKGDLIFFTDSDRQFEIKDIVPFLEKINSSEGSGQVDLVIGYRKNRRDSRMRILYAWLFKLACFIFFGVRVKDIDCAFKLFKKYVISDMKLVSDGALINLEILAKAKKKSYKFIELPVCHLERKEGKQTGGSSRVIFKAISQILFLWIEIFLK